VRADLRGRGIGTVLLEAFLARVDETGGVAYLETDTERNAHYYERFGFSAVGQAEVLGVRCWFISRR
jgi:GNAT superfamily N-acetyltransferase